MVSVDAAAVVRQGSVHARYIPQVCECAAGAGAARQAGQWRECGVGPCTSARDGGGVQGLPTPPARPTACLSLLPSVEGSSQYTQHPT